MTSYRILLTCPKCSKKITVVRWIGVPRQIIDHGCSAIQRNVEIEIRNEIVTKSGNRMNTVVWDFGQGE